MPETAARPETTSASGAARLGAELAAARARLGWELPQLAASLRIRLTYLEAIESGRVAELPGSTYAQGFVRAYAAALGLPAEDMAKRFRAETVDSTGKPALRFPAPVPQRGVPAGALMLLGLVILGAAYAGWYQFTERRAAKVETVPPIPERLAPAAPHTASPSPQVASLLPATAPPSPEPAAAKPAPATTQTPARTPAPAAPANPAPTTTTPAPPVTVATPPPAPQPAPAQAANPSPAPTAAPTAPPAPAGTRIMVKTTADAWVTIKQKGGPAVLNKMMHAGDSFAVPADKPDLTLTTGNAGGTSLEVDGSPIPTSLGTNGMVRRDLPLDAEMLKSGKLPAVPAKVKKPAAGN